MFHRSMMLEIFRCCAPSRVDAVSGGRGESSLASIVSSFGATTERDTCTNYLQSESRKVLMTARVLE